MINKSLHITIIIVLFFLFISCLIIPTPEHYSYEFGTRGEIDNETLEFMHVDYTKKEEVLLKLGEPDKTWKDERMFLYVWKMAIAIIGFYGGETHDIPKTYLLFIEFNENDIVKRYEVKERIFFTGSIVDEIDAW